MHKQETDPSSLVALGITENMCIGESDILILHMPTFIFDLRSYRWKLAYLKNTWT